MFWSENVGKWLVALLTIVLCLAFAVHAADPDPKTINVEVTLQQYAEITVLPTLLNWTAVGIGAVGGQKNLTVMNTGTVNVTDLYVYTDTLTDETTRPYGIDNPQVYAAGGLVVIINQSGFTLPEKFYFAGRLEWNWTEDLAYTDFTNLTYPVAYGFFKNTSREYFWAVGANASGDEGLCNQTDSEFALEDDVDAASTATRTPSTEDIVHDFSNKDFSFYSVNRATSPLYGYCVAVNRTCNKIYIYKYDKRAGYSNCVNSQYLKQAELTPSSSERLTLEVYAPKGLPAGTLKQATLTFAASSAV